MRTFGRAAGCFVAAASLLASSTTARADGPSKEPALVQAPPEEGFAGPPPEDNSHPSIEPKVTHPPWNGKEAIWGGVGLVIAGAATLIIAVPVTCLTVSNNGSETPCYATLGGSLGALGFGAILLSVGELQRSSYRKWLKTHPAFSGLSVSPSAQGPSLTWSVRF
jgi:hypothetical protein